MSSYIDDALTYAELGWEVFPLRGKIPIVEHGVLDATTDLTKITDWWRKSPQANVGGRVPAELIAIDIDPRHHGDVTWGRLVDEHGELITRTVITGRGDGGMHLFVKNPGDKIKATIGPGVDVKTNAGYTVLPPSIHPETGMPYRWLDPTTPFAEPPDWLTNLLRQPPPKPGRICPRFGPSFPGESPADWFTRNSTWGFVLGWLCGWTIVAGDGETDGSAWRHPTATATTSATIRHGLLFVYTTNTAFTPTTAADPHGYTKFHAYAVLAHGDDLSAAARQVRRARRRAA